MLKAFRQKASVFIFFGFTVYDRFSAEPPKREKRGRCEGEVSFFGVRIVQEYDEPRKRK